MQTVVLSSSIFCSQEKLQTELANAETNENEAAKAKIQAELEKTSEELENIVKKEGDLRKVCISGFVTFLFLFHAEVSLEYLNAAV